MDGSLYKDVQTSRGVNYHYLAVAPQADKPYLLFIHGFPSTSYDWHHQVAYFSELGYGLIVPDMLGYGGTSKPTEVEAYTNSRTAKDLVDILDAEGITQCIAIGHDWGSRVASRLADLYEDRFIAFAFLALGYIAPCPTFDMDEVLALTKKLAGYELLGYWKLFGAPDGVETIEKNLQSFYSALYPADPAVWRRHFAPLGAFRTWVESGNTAAVGAWLSDEDRKVQIEALLKGGMTGPLSWYKAWTSGLSAKEDKGIPIRSPAISKPTFFAATTQDFVCVVKPQINIMAKACADLKIHEFEAGHWVMMEKKDEFNEVFGSWLEDLSGRCST
ncbi:AB hydrolase superfamily protein [Pleurotus pulmonarius]